MSNKTKAELESERDGYRSALEGILDRVSDALGVDEDEDDAGEDEVDYGDDEDD